MSKILWGTAVGGVGLAAALALGGVQPAAQAGPGGNGHSASDKSGENGDAVSSTIWGDISKRDIRSTLTGSAQWSALLDENSLYSLETSQGITAAWAQGVTGQGVTVAVVDTGIAPVAGLDAQGKVVNGPDLSFDSQAKATRYVDAFGHGTHIAGIIAGRDAAWDRKTPNPDVFAGVAPDAKLLNMKVGAADGGADVSQVIAAINWVVQHRKDNGMNVRVITLAYGTESTQPWQVDPLAFAVENAWRAGIVVVAAAGNDGLRAPSLLMPALDPRIIAVGASDTNGTIDPSDDTVAEFTSGGDNDRRPDVVAPGRSVVSLRVPGSYVDTFSPGGRVVGDTSGRFFRGSGTSQATAFVAGEVALMLSARPKLTPDQVKGILMGTARPLDIEELAQGAGLTDVTAANQAPAPATLTIPPSSSGLGSLEASRGGEHVVDPVTLVPLEGEVDVLGGSWNPGAWTAAVNGGRVWDRGSWNGQVWTGDRLTDSSWLAATWSGTSWGGTPWSTYSQTSAQWLARSWRGVNWEARSWRDESWLARSWRSLL